MAFLDEVVTMGGLALQAEDCLLRAAVHHRGEHGGLVRLRNERYYQFIIWRAALSKWHAEVERNARDLIIRADGQDHHFEMKNWRNDSEKILQNDISRLSAVPNGGYLLVVSDNPKDKNDYTDTALSLASKLPGIGTPVSCYRFPTEDEGGNEFEFWLAGWPVPPSQTAAI